MLLSQQQPEHHGNLGSSNVSVEVGPGASLTILGPDRDTWAQGQQWARMLPGELARRESGPRIMKIYKEDTISRDKTPLPKLNTVLLSLRAPFQESPKFLSCSICFVRTL